MNHNGFMLCLKKRGHHSSHSKLFREIDRKPFSKM
jgi:hypothetical protein